MKKDYAYIAPLDKSTDQIIKVIQKEIEDTHSKKPAQWVPHITLARGSYLTDSELLTVKERFSTFKSMLPFKINLNNFIFQKKSEDNYSLRIAVEKNDNIKSLSEGIVKATKEFETPITVFTQEEYWITICGNISEKEKSKIKTYLDTIKIPKEVVIDKVSIFYSVFNSDKPAYAYEIAHFP